jgi:hypothetical protein
MSLPVPPGIPAAPIVIALGLETSPPTYSAIANLGDFAGPTQSTTTVDVSKHGDTWRRFVATLKDGGTVSMPCWFDPTNNTLAGNPDAIAELQKSAELRNYVMAFLNADGTFGDAIISFNAYITKFSQKFPVAGVWSADVEFRIDGEPVYLWADTTPPTGQLLP